MVDLTNAPREQRKAYQRMASGAGKGDLARNIYSPAFRNNYARINWKPKHVPAPVSNGKNT